MADFKTKCTEILQANRWLMSRLKHLKEPTKRLALLIEEKHTKPDDYLTIVTDAKLKVPVELKDLNLKAVRKILGKHDVGWSKDLWDKEEGKLCRFGMIFDCTETKFFMFLVINHCLADGASVYS